MRLIDIEEALDHLRVDSGDDEQLVELYIDAASNLILEYLDGGCPFAAERDENGKPIYLDGEPVYQKDSSGTPIVSPDIRAAALLLVGDLYRHRENTKGEVEFSPNQMPTYVSALLAPHRRGLGV